MQTVPRVALDHRGEAVAALGPDRRQPQGSTAIAFISIS